jgi:hypothetical protein
MLLSLSVHPIHAYVEIGGIAPLILNLVLYGVIDKLHTQVTLPVRFQSLEEGRNLLPLPGIEQSFLELPTRSLVTTPTALSRL